MNASGSMQKTLIVVLATLLLCTDLARAQTRPCNLVTKHACVGQDSVILCADVAGTLTPVPKPGTSVKRCSEGGFGLSTSTAVCYTSATLLENICAKPPSTACTAAGNFAVPGRCQDFYSCIKTGPLAADWTKIINSCKLGTKFNALTRNCVLAVNSGCIDNIPAPIVPPSTTVAPCTPLLSRKPDPSSCYQYIYCSQQGVKYTIKCPKNTFFDASITSCALTADCGSRPK